MDGPRGTRHGAAAGVLALAASIAIAPVACADVWGFRDLTGGGDVGDAMVRDSLAPDAVADEAGLMADVAESSVDSPTDATGGEGEVGPNDASADGGGLDGPQDAAEDLALEAPTCTCVGDLSNVGLGDFAIAFTIITTMQPTSPGYGAILNQRASCDSAHPGWDVFLNSGTSEGMVTLQIYDGSNVFDNHAAPQVVNDGQAHRVVLSRSSAGTVLTYDIDGAISTVTGQTAMALDGTLAALEQGVEPICSGNEAAPSESFVGTIDSVCIAIDCVPE